VAEEAVLHAMMKMMIADEAVAVVEADVLQETMTMKVADGSVTVKATRVQLKKDGAADKNLTGDRNGLPLFCNLTILRNFIS